LRTVGTLLTLLSVLLAAAALFAYANGVRTDRAGAAQHVLAAAETGVGAGRWHWLDAEGRVGEPVSEDAVIVPGDMLGFVTDDGALTDTRFSLPPHAGNDAQGQQLAIPDGDAIYGLAPMAPRDLEFARSPQWVLVAAGSALSFASGVGVLWAGTRVARGAGAAAAAAAAAAERAATAAAAP
jgi:hypothetical protein